MSFIIPLMLVCITVSSVQSVTKKKTGDSIVLQPGNKPEKLNSIVWKHGEDRAAEWYEGDADVSYYRIFNGSSVLDKLTCSLTIKNLDKDFIGTYTAEINGLNPTKSETLEVFDPVSDVTISPDPECTDDKSDNCTLTCKGTGDGPFTYSWTPGGLSASKVMVQKAKEVTEYTCVVHNPVSSKEEKYTVQAKGSSTNGAAIGVPIALVLLAIAIAICLYLWYRKKRGLALFNRGEDTNEGQGGAGGAGGAGDAGGAGGAPVDTTPDTEQTPMTDDTAAKNNAANNLPGLNKDDDKGKNIQNGEPTAKMGEAQEGGTNEGEGGAGGAGVAGGAGDAQVVVNMKNKNEHVGNKNEHVGNNPDDNNMPKAAAEGVKGKSTQNGEPIATMEEAREGDANEGQGGAGGAGDAGRAGGAGGAPVVVNMEKKNEHVGKNPDDNNMPKAAAEGEGNLKEPLLQKPGA